MGHRDYLGISELGQCQARVWWSHNESVEPDVSEESQRVMEVGRLSERMLRRDVRKKEGIRIYGPQQEVQFFEAKGHIDGWMKLPTGEATLWEAKSTTGYSLAKWRQEALPRHISWQIHGYMWGLGQSLGKEVVRTRLDVLDRVNGEVWVWNYERDDAVLQAARDRVAFLSEALTHENPPEREFEENSTSCQYCPFRRHCRPEKVYPDARSEAPMDGSSWEGFQAAIDLHQAGQQLEEEGKSLVAKARETLLSQLESHRATKARVNGTLVTWSQVETNRFNAKEFQQQHPDLHAAFVVPSSFQRLSISRR